MVNSEVGEFEIRGENIERAVKGFANKLMKLRQVLLMESSSNESETFYRENKAPNTASGNRNINLVARGALPPEMHTTWEKVTTQNRKFLSQELVFFEDIIMNAINTQARVLFKVAETIANSVDLYIYSELTNATGTSGVVAASDTWNSITIANRDPIGDLLIGEAAMMANNYDVLQNGFLLLSPKDYGSLLRNTNIVNNPSFKTADVVSNGVVGQIVGLKIIVSTSVTAGEAMIVFGNRAATWKGVKPLQTFIIEDQGISTKIRAVEVGHIQITDPEGLYTITGTQV